MIQGRKKACLKACKLLGISKVDFLEFPDMRLDSIPKLEINKQIEKIIQKFKPHRVYTTPDHDLNDDHIIVHDSTLIATRPFSSTIKEIFSYELPGLVKTPFVPNFYENVNAEILTKIKACNIYETEIKKFPHPRSIKAIEGLSIIRGSKSNLKNAEAFKIIKIINN